MKSNEHTPAGLRNVAFGEASDRPIEVLLIEDNEGFCYFVRDALMRKNAGRFKLRQASTLTEGLSSMAQSEPDCLLLDLGLPDSSGLDTFTKAQAGSPRTPIIILTVLDDDRITMRVVREGAQDYLLKDRLDPHLLVRSIRYSIERARSEEAVREMSGRILQLQDQERRRIAQALHDTTAQNLAALAMNLSILNRQASGFSPQAKALLKESMAFADQCCAELRTTAYLLHPPLLDQVGLAGAVREYADGFADRSGIRVDLELPQDLRRLPKEMETALFRIMQESLTNIHRHSGSKTASIVIEQTPEEVSLIVQDSGGGLPRNGDGRPEMPASRLGVGIAGMRERMRQLGGRMKIDSGPTGTTVTAVLPAAGRTP